MEWKIGEARLELLEGDITRQDTEAIVNAANSSLLGGGGVDGAIHRAGGPAILEECRRLGGCPTGEARLTHAGNLKARYVIHTVGPVYRGGGAREAEMLASCYRESLKLASRHAITSLAFPAISTGAYGYPPAAAARIALQTVLAYLNQHAEIKLVRFVLFSHPAYEVYEKTLRELLQKPSESGER
jgi:O-acetyl-ADP-ribose deacetylase